MAESVVVSEAPSRSLASTIAANALFITLGRVALKVINFLFSIYVVRRLGDDRFGQYSTVIAFVGIFQILAELGVSQYVMREIARDRNKAPELFWNLVALRFLLAAAGMLGITAAGAVTGYSPELVAGIFIYTATFLFAAFEAPLETVLTACERFDIVAVLGVLGQVVFIAFGGLFLVLGLNYLWLIGAGLIGFLPQIVVAACAIRRYQLVKLPFKLNLGSWPSLIRAGLPFGLISLALTVAFNIDTVILSKWQPAAVVGWYSVAYGLILSLSFFFSGFKDALVPSLSRAYLTQPGQVEAWYFRSVKFILILSIPLAVGGTLIAFPLIQLLYTRTNLPAALALQVIIWDVPVLMFSAFCGNMTTIVGAEHAAARVYGAAAVVNVLLNLFAIPRYGLIGASVVTVATDLIAALLFHLLLSRQLHLPDMRSALARIGVASAFMGLLVYWAGSQNFVLRISLGAATYLVLIIVFRLIDEREWQLISKLLRRAVAAPLDKRVSPAGSQE